MFEIKTALSYLIPRRKQLSVSVVGLIAVGVIQAIVWLILVFFSTTEGIEHGWSSKISGVLGPIHVVPAPAYYDSPLCQIDTFCINSSNQPLRISKKHQQEVSYDPEYDLPLPKPLKDWYDSNPKNGLSQFIEYLHTTKTPFRFFESTVCHLAIPTLAASPTGKLNCYSLLFGLDHLDSTSFSPVSEMSSIEVDRLLDALSNTQDPSPALITLASSIKSFTVVCTQDIVDSGNQLAVGQMASASFVSATAPHKITLQTPSGSSIPFVLSHKKRPFTVTSITLQTPPVAINPNAELGYQDGFGYPVLLPKQLRQQGVRLLDEGIFEFFSETSPQTHPLQIPFFVAGFFDSGILPIGGKLCLTSRAAVQAIEPHPSSHGPIPPTGIIIDSPLSEIATVQDTVQTGLDTHVAGLFSLQKYDEYEATRDLYGQLASEKTLFQLISCIIICVACSNIFSMLFILAHDRRKEIAVLRALGMSKIRIILVFFIAGLAIGLLGTLIGTLLASITLHFLPDILIYIGHVQGKELLNEAIYGVIESQMIRLRPMLFTIASISLVSGIAGLLAAIRACTTNISEALRS